VRVTYNSGLAFFFLFFVVLGFELRDSGLLGALPLEPFHQPLGGVFSSCVTLGKSLYLFASHLIRKTKKYKYLLHRVLMRSR
jgi:hypothetical protein